MERIPPAEVVTAGNFLLTGRTNTRRSRATCNKGNRVHSKRWASDLFIFHFIGVEHPSILPLVYIHKRHSSTNSFSAILTMSKLIVNFIKLVLCLLGTYVSGFVSPRHGRVVSGRAIIGIPRKRSTTPTPPMSYNAKMLTATAIENRDDYEDGKLNPGWKEIWEIPIVVKTQGEFDSIPLLKRLAIISRVSVLHLTILSCFGPFILRGTLGGTPLTLGRAALFTLDGLSWHVVHNMLNDWQDLDDDDDVEDSFRLAYGCHALKQGFMSKKNFLATMALLAAPGLSLTWLFRNTVLAPAALFGIVALFFYTILFKPLAMGEIVIYLVWGPLMAGFG